MTAIIVYLLYPLAIIAVWEAGLSVVKGLREKKIVAPAGPCSPFEAQMQYFEERIAERRKQHKKISDIELERHRYVHRSLAS